jgi:hypothetical protein
LDNFISPIPNFDGDIPNLAIPVLTCPLGGESIEDPSTGSNAGASKTRAGKRKANANPTLQKKAKKSIEKSSSKIKINEPAPKAPTSTPLLGPRKGIPIHRSRRYTHLEYFSLSNFWYIMNLHAEYPQDINSVASAKSVLVGSESPKVGMPPSLQAEKTAPEYSKPLSPEGA